MTLPALPLTPSGKVDRRVLPAPEQPAAEASAGYVAPRRPLEALLASICAEVLGLERVSVSDSFFDLGGNSLLATQVATLVQEVLPLELPLRNVFETPTVAGIAGLLEASASRLSDEERQAMDEVLSEFEELMAGEKEPRPLLEPMTETLQKTANSPVG